MHTLPSRLCTLASTTEAGQTEVTAHGRRDDGRCLGRQGQPQGTLDDFRLSRLRMVEGLEVGSVLRACCAGVLRWRASGDSSALEQQPNWSILQLSGHVAAMTAAAMLSQKQCAAGRLGAGRSRGAGRLQATAAQRQHCQAAQAPNRIAGAAARLGGALAAAAAAALVGAGGAWANADLIAEFPTSGFIFKDTVKIVQLEDPQVDGVVIYLTDYQRSLTERLAKVRLVAAGSDGTQRRSRDSTAWGGCCLHTRNLRFLAHPALLSSCRQHNPQSPCLRPLPVWVPSHHRPPCPSACRTPSLTPPRPPSHAWLPGQ